MDTNSLRAGLIISILILTSLAGAGAIADAGARYVEIEGFSCGPGSPDTQLVEVFCEQGAPKSRPYTCPVPVSE